MQSYRRLTPNDSSMSYRVTRDSSSIVQKDAELMIESPEYRSALRAVSQISGADGGISKPRLTIEELEGVITPEVHSLDSSSSSSTRSSLDVGSWYKNGVTWRVISELLKFGFSTELESVDDQMKSAIIFNRVHGFGKVRSLALYVLFRCQSGGWMLAPRMELGLWMIYWSLRRRSMVGRSQRPRRWFCLYYPRDGSTRTGQRLMLMIARNPTS